MNKQRKIKKKAKRERESIKIKDVDTFFLHRDQENYVCCVFPEIFFDRKGKE